GEPVLRRARRIDQVGHPRAHLRLAGELRDGHGAREGDARRRRRRSPGRGRCGNHQGDRRSRARGAEEGLILVSPITVGETSRGARRTRRAPRDTVIAFAMLAPALVLLGIFVIWPMVYSAYLSFFDWSFYQESTFVGFENFRRVLTDQAFIDSVGRGLLFALIVVPVQLTLAFAFASLVSTVGRRLAGVM